MFNILNALNSKKDKAIVSVASGIVFPLAQVNDNVFSKKLMGDGVAVKPDNGLIVAPAAGEITMIFPTNHSFGMKLDNGIEILVHIGIDTVNLQGKGFIRKTNVGAQVKKGTPIIQIDNQLLESKVYDMTTMIIFTNRTEYNVEFVYPEIAKRGKTIIATYQRKAENE
ncbi:PTS system glucose-specific EIIA component [bioreactor metagenome]|uniref:PTS system glucose-specific EIIA component n=1 Tax=bioreactor metagenome TaxID=1076179 RepID=A0A645F6G8_9ZZZZ